MSINPDDMEARLKAIEVEVFDNGKAYWMERASRAEALVEKMMTDPPAQMSTPLGLLPVNAEGMMRLSDALGKAQKVGLRARSTGWQIARHYQRQLQTCDDLLTKQGVPEWVENSDSNGVPGNAVIQRLKWYLARRKDVKPEEAEPQLQAEMAANLAAAKAYRSND